MQFLKNLSLVLFLAPIPINASTPAKHEEKKTLYKVSRRASNSDLKEKARFLMQKLRELDPSVWELQEEIGDHTHEDAMERRERLLRIRLRKMLSGSFELAAAGLQKESQLFEAVDAGKVQKVQQLLDRAVIAQKSDIVHLRDQRGLLLHVLQNHHALAHRTAWECWRQAQINNNGSSELISQNSADKELELFLELRKWIYTQGVNEGFTALMKACGQGNKELVSLLITRGAIVQDNSLTLDDWMVDPTVEINAEALAAHLKWKLKNDEECPAGPNMKLADFIRCELGMASLKYAINPLSLAAIGGHTEVVALLLQSINSQKARENGNTSREQTILRALNALIYSSDLISTEFAGPLFQCLVGSPTPKHDNYAVIGRLLVRALVANTPVNNLYGCDLKDYMRDVLLAAMDSGSTEMLQVIAGEMAQEPVGLTGMYHIPADPVNSRKVAKNELLDELTTRLIKGDKLGILLSLNADAQSLVYQLGHGVLERVTKNPPLLASLQKFMSGKKGVDQQIVKQIMALQPEPVQQINVNPEVTQIINDNNFHIVNADELNDIQLLLLTRHDHNNNNTHQ